MTTKTPPSKSIATSQPPTAHSASDDTRSDMPLTPLTAPSGNTEQVASLNSSARFQRLSRPDARTRADLIKRSCRIEDVVMGQGVLLRVVGDGHHLVGLCPFHREQRASFTVYPDTQSFCCFGCHAAGDVITFICLLRQVTFTEALHILGEQHSDALPRRC